MPATLVSTCVRAAVAAPLRSAASWRWIWRESASATPTVQMSTARTTPKTARRATAPISARAGRR